MRESQREAGHEVLHPRAERAKDEHDDVRDTSGPAISDAAEPKVEEIALAEIANWTKETFQPPNALNKWMKGQSMMVQTKITAAYNARKKALDL